MSPQATGENSAVCCHSVISPVDELMSSGASSSFGPTGVTAPATRQPAPTANGRQSTFRSSTRMPPARKYSAGTRIHSPCRLAQHQVSGSAHHADGSRSSDNHRRSAGSEAAHSTRLIVCGRSCITRAAGSPTTHNVVAATQAG